MYTWSIGGAMNSFITLFGTPETYQKKKERKKKDFFSDSRKGL